MDRRRFISALPGATLTVVGGSALARGAGVAAIGFHSGGPASRDPPGGAPPGPTDGPPARPPASLRPLEAVGIQLYTLRSVLRDDMPAVLAELGAIGYREVELAGTYGRTAREMLSELDAAGLQAASSHHGLDEVRGDWDAVLDGATTLGQSLVVVPSIPGNERNPEGLRRIAEDFNRAGERARSAGLRFGYHNHDWELRAMEGGGSAIDLLLELTDPELVDWQMDIFWTAHAGADPVGYLARHPGRATSFHVKDRSAAGEMVDVGRGAIDFAPVFAAAGEHLRHAFVEHDAPADPLDTARTSYQATRAALDAASGRAGATAAPFSGLA